MQLYSCKLRLNSNVNHEVMKVVTVPEIVVLRVIHSIGVAAGGAAPVADVKALQNADGRLRHLMVRDDPSDPDNKAEHTITDKEERERLKNLYGAALAKSKDTPNLAALFGFDLPLPKTADGVPEPVIIKEPVKRTVVKSPSDTLLAELA